jgi:hypothetical protein
MTSYRSTSDFCGGGPGILPIWWPRLLTGYPTLAGLGDAFARQGITHLLVPCYGLGFLEEMSDDSLDRSRLPQVLADWPVVFEDQRFVLFARPPLATPGEKPRKSP